jgi:hypothetical protein
MSETNNLTLKRYSVHVEGFDPYQTEAETASKARYKAYKGWREAGYGRPYPGETNFRDFLRKISTTLHLGRAHNPY